MAFVALLVFIAIVVAIMLGYPVAISLGGVSLLIGYFTLGPSFLQFLPSRVIGILSNYVLLAVPMFILMGLTLQKSRLAEILLRSLANIAGKRSGGLALAVLGVGALLAASTGIVGASVVTLGLIALPAMKKAGYSPEIAAGIVASAGSLGQVVPPSIVLILLASVMQVSVGDLFHAAVLPSTLIIAGYALYILGVAVFRPSRMPPISIEATDIKLIGSVLTSTKKNKVWLGVLGPLVLIFGVLGSILAGIASPTEASGVGAIASMVLLYLSGNFTKPNLKEVVSSSVELTAMVFLILIGATTFALVFRGLGGDDFLVEYITISGISAVQFLLLLLVIVFVAGFFIDFIEIIFIVVPVVLPIIQMFGIDPIWVALLLGINLQTSFLTPPFGFSLFYLRAVATSDIKTSDIYKGVLPFVMIQLFVLAIVFIIGL